MAKTIVFKPEFEKKLKDLKIKTKFVKNIKIHCKKCKLDINDRLLYLNGFDLMQWGNFISSAFIFTDTAEEFDYWYSIANS